MTSCQDEIWLPCSCGAKRGKPVGDGFDLVTAHQQPPNVGAHVGVVIHKQNPRLSSAEDSHCECLREMDLRTAAPSLRCAESGSHRKFLDIGVAARASGSLRALDLDTVTGLVCSHVESRR